MKKSELIRQDDETEEDSEFVSLDDRPPKKNKPSRMIRFNPKTLDRSRKKGNKFRLNSSRRK